MLTAKCCNSPVKSGYMLYVGPLCENSMYFLYLRIASTQKHNTLLAADLCS